MRALAARAHVRVRAEGECGANALRTALAQLHIRIRKAMHSPFAKEVTAKAKAIVKRALNVDVAARADASTITHSLIKAFALNVEAMPSR